MPNEQRKIRVPRIQTPWEPASNRNEEVIYEDIYNWLRKLEDVKLEAAQFGASGAVFGDILVADSNLVFRPQKFVPLTFGVGTNLSVTGTATVTGATNLKGVLNVTGSANVTGATLLLSTLGVGTNLSVTGTATVTGNTLLRGTLGVSGLTTIGGALNVSGLAAVVGNHSVGGNLGVSGNTFVMGVVGIGTNSPVATIDSTSAESGSGYKFGYRGTGELVSSDLSTYAMWMNQTHTPGNGQFATSLYGGGIVAVNSPNSATAFSIYAAPMTKVGDGGLTTFGLYLAKQTEGVTNYQLYSAGGENWFVSSDATDRPLIIIAHALQTADLFQVREAGGMGILRITNIGTAIHRPLDAATNTITAVLTLDHHSLGTPTDGFGSALAFDLTSSVSESQNAVRVRVGWQTATHASRAASGAIDAYYTTTARECLNWAADSSAARIGFLGAAHQPRTSAYTPTNVTTDRSYNANATTVDELADVLGTLIADLQAFGLLG